ncbi:hypothetical protein A8F94_22600 [Bacillus sp. FJAT-27225]|nr:hypothetical protein A8F94_22600 [Bacillus sp. FJAT-27225]
MKEFVFHLLGEVKKIIKSNFIGFYIHGSLAMGCFNPKNSDIDILVLTDSSIGIEDKGLLARLFLAISTNPFPVEVSFLNQGQLQPFEHPCPFDFHYSEFWRERYEKDLALGSCEFINDEILKDPDLAAHLTITIHRGICIEGTPIKEIFPSIPRDYYISSIMGDFKECIDKVLENPVYCTLNLMRVYWYLKDGMISSKQEAGNWALSSLPKEMHQTVKKLLYNYSNEKDYYSFESSELLLIRDYINGNVGQLLKKQRNQEAKKEG